MVAIAGKLTAYAHIAGLQNVKLEALNDRAFRIIWFFRDFGNNYLFCGGLETMRYIQTPVFKFEELSDKAKARATNRLMDEHFWGADSLASLEAFAGQFNIKVTSWSYAPFGSAEIDTDAENSHFRGFNLKKAKALPEYPTGYCLDYTLREVFVKEFERAGDALQAFNDAMDAGIKEARDDWESQYSNEYMQEHCEANNYEFDENGNLI